MHRETWAWESHHVGHDCGCHPARPSATDDRGYLTWAGKVWEDTPYGPESWSVHP